MKKKTFREVASEVPAYIDRQLELQEEIANRIKALIRHKGITQKELAHDIGMSESQLSDILTGEVNVTIKTIARFEKYFGQDIIGVASDMKSKPYVYRQHDIGVVLSAKALQDTHMPPGVITEPGKRYGSSAARVVEYTKQDKAVSDE